MTTPAGWYPDPHVPGQQRWWDGATWTQHVAALPPTPTTTPPATHSQPSSAAWYNSTGPIVVTILGVFAAVVVVAVAVSAGGQGDDEPGGQVAATDSSTPSPTGAPDITPPAEAKVRYSKSCDMLLFTGGFGRSSFVGQAVLHNSGGLPAEVRVTGTWVQVGSKPLREEKVVTVPAGGRRAVNLKVVGGSDEVAAYQAGYGGPPECRVVAKIVG